MGLKLAKSSGKYDQPNEDDGDAAPLGYGEYGLVEVQPGMFISPPRGNADERENYTLGYRQLPSARSSGMNFYITPIADGVQNKRESRRDTGGVSASSNTRRSRPRYNTKTGTLTGQRHNGRSRKQLDHTVSDKTAVSRDAEIESMVKKYRTKIVNDVIVGHIISWMKTFIDTYKIDEIADKDSNAAAMEALLDRIKHCKMKGRWQRFVDALRENNYDYICNLLQGGSKKKGISVQQKLLHILTPEIINRINPVELARYLLSQNAINDYDLETIQREEQTKGKRFAANKLLNVVPNRSANWVQLLCDAMRAEGQDDLAEQFLVHYEEVSSNTEGPHTSSNSEFENTSETSTLDTESRPQLPKRRPKLRSSRQRTKPSKVTYQNIRDAEQVQLEDEIDSLRRKSIIIEGKEQMFRELQRKEDKLKKEYGKRPDFELDLSELRRKTMVLEGKEQLMQELTKKENDFKLKFGKGVENTEDNSELVKKLAALQTKMLLFEQIGIYGEKLSHLEGGKKDFRKAKKKKRSVDGDGTYNSFIPDEVQTNALLSVIESMVSREVRRRIPPGFLEHDYQDIERDFKLPRPHFNYTSDYYSFST